uniref:Uncharacterized protein n=1 Tax=Arundo donax TaxID=35708 RepID=A0A0A9BX53_ARUDO
MILFFCHYSVCAFFSFFWLSLDQHHLTINKHT